MRLIAASSSTWSLVILSSLPQRSSTRSVSLMSLSSRHDTVLSAVGEADEEYFSKNAFSTLPETQPKTLDAMPLIHAPNRYEEFWKESSQYVRFIILINPLGFRGKFDCFRHEFYFRGEMSKEYESGGGAIKDKQTVDQVFKFIKRNPEERATA